MGFIRDLPRDLFAAFRATFEEAADADLLLHVVDASDASAEDHIGAVLELLEELELTELPRLVVFNKIDRVEAADLRALSREHPEAAFVSATRRESTRPLIERIARELAQKWVEASKGPNVEPAAPDADVEPGADPGSGPGEMTTVDEMRRAAGKRVRSRVVH